MQHVLDWESEEDGRPCTGGHSAEAPPGNPQLHPHKAAMVMPGGVGESSPPLTEPTAARVERLRDNLERQLGLDRFLSVYKSGIGPSMLWH